MTLTSVSDVSLYELALATDPTLPILQVSPATLKAAFSAFLELLSDRALSAVIWAKLPRGAIWQAELARYSALDNLPQAVYVFKNQREEGVEETLVAPSLVDPGTEPELLTEPIAAPLPSVWLELLLAPDSHLRREYFLVVWTAEFQGCILAHRPRSAQLAKPSESSVLDTGAGLAEPSGAIDDTQERRQTLLILSSFDSHVIAQVLQGLEQTLTTDASLPAAPLDDSATLEAAIDETIVAPTDAVMTLAEAVIQWQSLTAATPITTLNAPTLGQLFVKQMQRQEEMLQRNVVYRRQADLVEILQMQKEELTSALRSKADFINTVGQELRTPLTTIKTALTLLNSPSLKPSQRQRYMDLIAKECDRQSSLITSLLDLVQLDQAVNPTALQAIRVSDIVPGVVSTYQPLAEEKGVQLAYTVPEDLPTIACMGNWLKQIVINLLHNGIKFTPSGGQVWVRAKRQGNYINLEVRDTGVGIAPQELPKIFDRFYRVRQTTSEDTGGSGLGLTIVQQLLLHCGGSISVKSRPGEGSTFTVLLPIHPNPAPLSH